MTHRDHTQDHQRANNEVVTTDVTSLVSRVFGNMFGGNTARPGGMPHGHHSSFEGRKLNEMLDLVEHGTPHHLANAGEALWSARDAISDAAEDLNSHITNVDWHGDSGTQFREWGVGLVENARALSDFAGNAGTQITVAGSGLASVQKSMPPRDTRANPKDVHELPAHKRVKGDPEYDAAVQVEGHRQEAINQMTRLASFYSVASGGLAKQKTPTFDVMPDVGVPRPAGYKEVPGGSGQGNTSLTGVSQPSQGVRHTATGDVPSHTPAHLQTHGTIDEVREPQVGTEIDSVQPLTPTPPSVDPPPTLTQSTQGTQGPNNPVLSFTNEIPNTSQNGMPKAFGRTTPSEARGVAREGLGGNRNSSASGRGLTNGMGRGPVNQAKATGRGGTTGRMPMGRGGVSGGKPRTAGPAKTSQAGAVRKGGVVGGRPTAEGSAKGTSSRVPRGTVIGGRQEQENTGRVQGTAGRAGQRGVIGAPKTPENNKTQAVRRTPGTPEGVLGAPKGQSTGPKGERGGFTSGGSGLVRGQRDQRHPSDEDRYEEETGLWQHHQDVDGVEPHEPQHRPPHAPPAND